MSSTEQAMIINGGSRCNRAYFTTHLTNDAQNDRVTLAEVRGLAAEDVGGAFKEMEAVASGTRCKNYFYHANINPRDDEQLTPAQWAQSVDTLEKHLGLEGHARFVVEHEKAGRTHRHVIWSRIDVDRMRAVAMDQNYAKHQLAARELEVTFDLARGQSVLGSHRDGPRPERGPQSWEMFRGHESGIDPREVTAEVTALWRSSDSGTAFTAALEERGYILAQGDRRDFCVIDRAGDTHSLARRIEGATAADVRARMADIDRQALPNVEQAEALQHERIAQRAAERTPDAQRAEDVAPQAPAPDDRDALRQQRAARLAATLYDRADMVSMQHDAMRDVQARIRARRAGQAQGHQPDTAPNQATVRPAPPEQAPAVPTAPGSRAEAIRARLAREQEERDHDRDR